MASTYVNDLRLNEMATGDASGTWGTITNTNLELIGEALGYGTQDCFTSDADATTTVADGATDPARAIYFKVTSSATLTATRTLTIAPNTVSRLQFIENATTGSQSINISQGSGANVTIGSGETKAVYLDGAGSGAAVVDSFATFSVANARFADGSNSAPSISFTSDTNTGIYRGGTDILKFVTAGVDAITIDATQRVAIGTSTIPTSESVLTIRKDGSANEFNILSGTSSASVINMGDADDYNIQRIKADNTDNSLQLQTNNAEAMRITSAGKVGIGTSSPTGKLEINGSDGALFAMRTTGDTSGEVMGTQYLNNSGAVTAQTFATGDSSSSSVFRIKAIGSIDLIGGDIGVTGAGPDLRITAAGYVGIGTASPTTALTLGTSHTATVQNGGSNSAPAYAITSGALGTSGITAPAANSLGFVASATERMRIDSSGNVGIGTDSPSFKVDIQGTDSQSILIKRTDASVVGGLQLQDFSTGGLIRTVGAKHLRFDTDSTERMQIDSSGNLLVGTTSTVPYTLTSGTGAGITSSGTVMGGATGEAGLFNRVGGDGNIINFYRTGSIVGSISYSSATNIAINNANSKGLGIGSGSIFPTNGGPSVSDAGLDLGYVSGRWKDLYLSGSAYVSNLYGQNDGNTGIQFEGSDVLTIHTGGAERMRIDSSGNVLVGTTTVVAKFNAVGSNFGISSETTAGTNGGTAYSSKRTSDGIQMRFYQNSTVCGDISTNGSAVNYGSNSDYRLKENVVTDWDATTRLKQLNPVRFNFIANADTTVDGFLAHEVQSVVPEAISGTHNEVDADGNPVYQGIDQSKLVPLLVKTIQELEARITALENGV